MQVDKTTLSDLSIFHQEDDYSVLHHLNFTRTNGGRLYLTHLLSRPLGSIREIEGIQLALKKIIAQHKEWSATIITNGTIMVIERFYETAIQDTSSYKNGAIGGYLYRFLHASDFSLIRYSLKHFIDFIMGLDQILRILEGQDNPRVLQLLADRMQQLFKRPDLQGARGRSTRKDLTPSEVVNLGHYFKYHFKEQLMELIDIYSRLDAYYSMATACIQYKFTFPEFVESEKPLLSVKSLYHPMIPVPVSYDFAMDKESSFLFLTGANMAGKSTFIKATGVAVYLAHTGMGIPAEKMELSLFNGLLSNINVTDNIMQGESYFFNEVQRIKNTIEKISDGKKWLILIDELFKGTNVQDAMKCSTSVVEGLRKMQNSLFLLSTHLYEIGESLKKYSNIQFRYFETTVAGDQLIFSYQLKEGISNDRLGYLILRREGVVEMLEKL